MKKRTEKRLKRVIPASAAGTEEAEWWYKTRNRHGSQLLAAVKSGEAQLLTQEKLRERIAASKERAAPVMDLGIKPVPHETPTDREKLKPGR